MEKKIKNILVISLTKKEKYYFSLIKIKDILFEKSFVGFTPLIKYEFSFKNILFKFNLNILSIASISPKIQYDGIIKIYDSENSLDFLEKCEEKFRIIFGDKVFPTLLINIDTCILNKSNFPKINLKNKELTELKWIYVFKTLANEFIKEEEDQFPYSQINSKNHIINSNDFSLKIITFNNQQNNLLFLYFIFLLLIILNILNLYLLYFTSEFINIVYKHDGIVNSIKTFHLLLFFNFTFFGIIVINSNKKNIFDKYYFCFRFSLFLRIIEILGEIIKFVKEKNFYNRKKGYLISHIIFNIIYFLLYFTLFFSNKKIINQKIIH